MYDMKESKMIILENHDDTFINNHKQRINNHRYRIKSKNHTNVIFIESIFNEMVTSLKGM